MNREQLAHLLRASAHIAGDPNILVIGSQAILGSFDEDDLPAPATASREVDVAFLNDPGGQKADQVDGAIGELSPFDEQFGYYAQGVEVSTAVLPTGWEDRVITWQSQSARPAQALFLEPHDLAMAKLAAFRDKDRAFVTALLDATLLAADTLFNRLADLPVPRRTHDRIAGFLRPWRS
ncbi:MAG: hypothetical protein L0H41_16915 [Microlunatus sp.]|nr:hypothetical protein [Microlunatus sp.]